MVTVYDIENGEDKTYQLETIPSTHTHSVLVRAEDFTQLSEGKQIELWSSDAHGHRHQIILSCI